MSDISDGAAMQRSLLGKLLVASPLLRDPNFEHSVVLLVAHDDASALGVVLNRATEVEVTAVLDGWESFVAAPSVVFEGGPVQPEAAICVARTRPDFDVEGFSPFMDRIGTLDVSREPESFSGQLDRLRVFAGYAGWEAGQLEAEIAEGAWFICDALPGDPFVPQPDDLWSMVLRRQSGLLAAVAFFPPDPALN
ncbi:MAG: YqgE/AlgH family protein [Mycobacteriales bacterium]